MLLLIRFIRIYAPFVCTLATLINGVIFVKGFTDCSEVYVLSAFAGSSIFVTAYMFVTSFRMCKWYKLNLLCLLLTQLCSIAYNYLDIDTSLYLWVVTLLSGLGIMLFLIFRIFYKVTNLFLCIGRY